MPNVGDEIKLAAGAKYINGNEIPEEILDCKLYVKEIQGDNIVFYAVPTYAVSKKYLSTHYLVRVTVDVLNVRAGAGTSYKIKTTVKKGDVYTIVEENNGWGRLLSGAGWICLDYTEKM